MAMSAEIDRATGVETLDHKAIGEESLAPQTTRIMDP